MKKLLTFVRVVFAISLFVLSTVPVTVSPKLMLRIDAGEITHGPANTAEDCMPKYPPPPTVKIHVRVPAHSDPGDAIEYRICVENCSTAEAHHVVVKNALPANAKFVKADPEPSKQGPELQWNLGTIGGGARREIVLVLQPTNREDVKNCARVSFEHGQCVVTRQTGSRPFISPVPEVIKPEDMPVLDLVVRGPKEQYTNLASKYEITITNKGKTRSTNTQVTARMPDKMKIVGVSDSGAVVESAVAWNLGTLEPGASRVMQLTLRVSENGEFCFKVAAVADLGLKKELEYCTKFAGVSALSVEMYDREDPVFVNHKTSYPVVIQSQGNAPLTNVRVRAFIPEALKLERANAAFDREEAVIGGHWIEFKKLSEVEAGSQRRYEIFVEALKSGVTRFHIEVMADQLDAGRPVIEQESTTIADDRAVR